MMTRGSKLYLKDILDSINNIESYVTGMRDKMTHEYFGIDLKIVWKTIKQSLPILKRSLKPLLK